MRGWFDWRREALSTEDADRSFSEIEASTSSLSSLPSSTSSSSPSLSPLPSLQPSNQYRYSIISNDNRNSITTARNKRLLLMINIISVIIVINIIVFVIIHTFKNSKHHDDEASTCTSSDCSTLQYYSFNNNDNNALCNDGSFGGYYYKASGVIKPLNVFIIFLPGGAQCYDEVSCLGRSSSLSSSSSWPQTKYGDGILSDNPSHSPLWYANKAYLGYCSSDGYMGNTVSWGLHFRGIALIDAMIYNLRMHHGLDDADLIVFAGVSAGARGVMANLDRLVDTRLFPQVPVIGYIDSPYYLDLVPYDTAFVGFSYAEQHKYQSMNTSGILSQECKNDFITTNNEWKCQLGQYRMPYIKSPYFFIASRFDTYQLGNNLGPPTGNDGLYSTAQINWANNFAGLTLAKVNNLITNASMGHLSSNVSRSYFVNACSNHAVSGTPTFYSNMKINGNNLYDAFSSFLKTYNDNHMTITSWIDSCNGFACGISC